MSRHLSKRTNLLQMEKDVISYLIMMKGYITNGMAQKAIDLFSNQKWVRMRVG